MGRIFKTPKDDATEATLRAMHIANELTMRMSELSVGSKFCFLGQLRFSLYLLLNTILIGTCGKALVIGFLGGRSDNWRS